MGWMRDRWDAFKRFVERDKQKIGGMHLYGMSAQGLSEIRAAASFEGSVAQPTEYGVFGKVTPGEVADDHKPKDKGTVHGPELDPVANAREQSKASGGQERDHDGNGLG